MVHVMWMPPGHTPRRDVLLRSVVMRTGNMVYVAHSTSGSKTRPIDDVNHGGDLRDPDK